MSRKVRSLAAIDTRLRELAAAKLALEQDLDQALGRALRRTRDHAPNEMWEAVQRLLAPHIRNDVDRRVLGVSQGDEGHARIDAPAGIREQAAVRRREAVPNASASRHATARPNAGAAASAALLATPSAAGATVLPAPGSSAAQLTLD